MRLVVCFLLIFSFSSFAGSVEEIKKTQDDLPVQITIPYHDIRYKYIKDEPQIFKKLKLYGLYKDTCNFLLDKLIILKVPYYGFDGKDEYGNIITLDIFTKQVHQLFVELKRAKCPIYGIDPFAGVDKNLIKKSIHKAHDDYNYTGSFSCRMKQNSSTPSSHTIASAIDINPLQNPFVGINAETKEIINVIPKDGVFYLNSRKGRPNKEYLRKGTITEDAKKIFYKNGYTIWGGNWDVPLDAHHFQMSSSMARLLVQMQKDDAIALLDRYIYYLKKMNIDIFTNLTEQTEQEDDLFTHFIELYNQDKILFWKKIGSVEI